MYLRHTTVTKNGKSHTYWRLVRSVRTGNKVRQQTVAQLGELDAAGRDRARALAEAIVGIERQPGLFDEPAPWAPECHMFVADKVAWLTLGDGLPQFPERPPA